MPNIDEVQGWIAAMETEVARLEEVAGEAQRQLGRARKQLTLYHEILATLTKSPVLVSNPPSAASLSVRDQTLSAAERVLRERGEPMSIQDIHTEFIRRGIPLPGRGTPANIIVHLGSSERIERLGRGLYGLVEWRGSKENDDAVRQPVDSGDQEAVDA